MIFFETSHQALTFLMLLRAGLGAGIAYDLIAPFRRRVPRPIAVFLDVLWCLILCGLCFFCLAMGGEERLRLYGLLGMASGGGVYVLGVRAAAAGIGRALKSWQMKKGRKKEPAISPPRPENELPISPPHAIIEKNLGGGAAENGG